MSKLMIYISYASMQAYEFDGIKNIDGIQKFQYHPICNSERNGELAISANVSSFFEELTKKLSDIYGNGWRNNLEMIVLWSPEFSSEQKSSFKQILLNNGVEKYFGIREDPSILMNRGMVKFFYMVNALAADGGASKVKFGEDNPYVEESKNYDRVNG